MARGRHGLPVVAVGDRERPGTRRRGTHRVQVFPRFWVNAAGTAEDGYGEDPRLRRRIPCRAALPRVTSPVGGAGPPPLDGAGDAASPPATLGDVGGDASNTEPLPPMRRMRDAGRPAFRPDDPTFGDLRTPGTFGPSGHSHISSALFVRGAAPSLRGAVRRADAPGGRNVQHPRLPGKRRGCCKHRKASCRPPLAACRLPVRQPQ
jgi:hypothetical protein